MGVPIEHSVKGASFAYNGLEFPVTSLTSITFGERIVRVPTGSQDNWLVLSEAQGQRAIFSSGRAFYEVIVRHVEPQYDVNPSYEGEVAVVTFEFTLKRRPS
jgi:hypothetical protein